MMKLKVVENEKLKVLTCVRTHPEELLALKIWFCVFFHVQFFHFYKVVDGNKLISWPFVLKKPGKSNFWDEEFFGMSSYTCENFQLFILYNFQFHHMVLKWVLTSKKRKIKFLGRRVLRDEFLHMWKLSTFHSLQLSISSYDVKTTSRRPKLHLWLSSVFIVIFNHFHCHFWPFS